MSQILSRCVLLACAALPAIAQLNSPFVFSVVNSASYGNSIAQGSLFVVFGANIGPAQLAEAAAYPLPQQIGGTSISITSGATMLACPMVYSTAGEVAAILPSSTPPGTASLSLSYNGQTTSFPAQVTVVPSAMGLYTLSSSGLGPGSVTSLTGAINGFALAAQPGETLTAGHWTRSHQRLGLYHSFVLPELPGSGCLRGYAVGESHLRRTLRLLRRRRSSLVSSAGRCRGLLHSCGSAKRRHNQQLRFDRREQRRRRLFRYRSHYSSQCDE